MTGPDGVTKQASSFSRRDAIINLATRSAIHGATADSAAMRIEILANRLLHDDRVVAVLARVISHDASARTDRPMITGR